LTVTCIPAFGVAKALRRMMKLVWNSKSHQSERDTIHGEEPH